MIELPTKLKIAIMDSDFVAAEALKAAIETKSNIEGIEIFESFEAIDRAFRCQGFNALFIDIFSIGVETGTEIIGHIREIYPISSVCLYSTSANLKEMPQVNKHWKERFQHYFTLEKKQNRHEIEEDVEASLCALSSHVSAVLGRSQRFTKQKEQEGEETTIEEKEREMRGGNLSNPPILSEIDIEEIESSIITNLNHSFKLVHVYAKIVIAVGVVFSALFFVSIILVCIRTDWKTIVLVGFGIVGLLTLLWINPLKILIHHANQLLLIQLNYFGFINQVKECRFNNFHVSLWLLNDHRGTSTPLSVTVALSGVEE